MTWVFEPFPYLKAVINHIKPHCASTWFCTEIFVWKMCDEWSNFKVERELWETKLSHPNHFQLGLRSWLRVSISSSYPQLKNLVMQSPSFYVKIHVTHFLLCLEIWLPSKLWKTYLFCEMIASLNYFRDSAPLFKRRSDSLEFFRCTKSSTKKPLTIWNLPNQ